MIQIKRPYVVSIKQTGLVLIAALIFLQVIAILGIYAVESALQAEKMSRLDWQQNTIFAISEQILRLVENHAQQDISNCLIPMMPQDDLLSKTLDWWQLPSHCAGNFQLFQYYYVMEKLGGDPCADIVHFDLPLKRSLAMYYRISLFILDKKHEAKEILQSTLITLDNAVLSCEGNHHPVFLGRQMWRELR